jgi:arylsulfatase A-like enzyme
VSRSSRIVLVLLICLTLGAAALGTSGSIASSGPRAPQAGAEAQPVAGEPAPREPNVVMVLVDDLDWSLMPYLPHVNELIRDQGASFPNFYTEQSSCCPSRASILSGEYAHNHGVIGNVWPEGGYDRWRETREGKDLPVWLEQAGWRSAMLGKYLNEYPFHPGIDLTREEKDERKAHVPDGWQAWSAVVQGNAYAQDHYKLNNDGVVDTDFRETYLDTWLGERMLSLVGGADGFDFGKGGQFVYYASYSPHTPYAYPPRYEGTFADETYPRTPDFDEADVSDKFGLTATRPPLTEAKIAEIDDVFRKRIRSLQVLDDNVARLVAQLDAQGDLDDTYIMFTSDNGYLMGNHRRDIGKYNQFQGTVNVPFFVRGPGIEPGTEIDDLAGNIDIAPTIADIAGAEAPEVDGVSLLDRLHGGAPLDRRFFLLGRALTPTQAQSATGLEEPTEDYVETDRSALLNDFTGVTNGRFKLVRYTHIPHEELYDLANDPYELDNLLRDDQESYDAMTDQGRGIVDGLRSALDRLTTCAGDDCR